MTLRVATRVLAAATTDAAGRYTLSAAGRPTAIRAALLAQTEDGRAGTVAVWLSASPQTLPTVVLAAAHDITLQVTREGAGVLAARVAAVRRDSGVPGLLALVDGDQDGRVTLRGLPEGSIEFYATAPGHGRGKLTLRLPRPADAPPATLALQGERLLSVYVYDEKTQRPVSGAQVLVGEPTTMPVPHGPGYLPPLPALRTDRRGYVVVRRLGSAETIYVNARASGYAFAPWWRSKAQTAPPKQSEVRIALPRQRVVRLPVVVDEVPAPADGTLLRVDSRGAQRDAGGMLRARMDRGDVVLEGLGSGMVMGSLIAPDGSLASFTVAAGATEGPTISFRLPRTVRVRVSEQGGAPVAGMPLKLGAGGRAPAIAPAVTDDDGIAVFEGVGGDRVSLLRGESQHPMGGPVLATLDLTAGIDVHEVVLAPGIDVLLTLRIDGVAALPPHYSILVAGRRIDAARIEENADTGELRCRVRPPTADGAVRIELHPEGFLKETVEADARDDRVEETFDLREAGRLIARVTPPDDGEYTLQLQRREKGAENWVPAQLPTPGMAARPRGGARGEDGTHTYDGLAPGRYRVFDRRARQASEPADVGIGSLAEVALDLSGAQWIVGHVVAPAGTNLSQARIVVDGRDDVSSIWSGVRPNAQGMFRVRGSRDTPVTLRVTHPTLRAAGRGGHATVRAGAGEVELRLEAGPELHFRVVGYEQASTPTGGLWHAPLTVHLVPEGATSARPTAIQPVADGGLFRAGGFAAGTYTLWITFGRGHAPLVRPGLVLGSTTIDLGTLTPPRGSNLRVRIAGLAERPTAAVWATVNHEGEPAYTRHGSLDRDAGELLSTGLGAGRFHVVVRGAGLSPGSPTARVLLDRIVTVDGESDVTLDVTLR